MKCHLLVFFLVVGLIFPLGSSGQQASGKTKIMSAEENERLVHPYVPYYSYDPIAIDGACIVSLEWFKKDVEPKGQPELYGTGACPRDSDGTCPLRNECAARGKSAKFQMGGYLSPREDYAKNRGVDKYGRKVHAIPDLPYDEYHDSASVVSIILANGKRANYCAWTFDVDEYTSSYDPKRDPKQNVVLCKPSGFKEAENKDGTKKINKETGRPFKAPTCDPLLVCIEKEVLADTGKLPEGSPKPLHAAEVLAKRQAAENAVAHAAVTTNAPNQTLTGPANANGTNGTNKVPHAPNPGTVTTNTNLRPTANKSAAAAPAAPTMP